MYVRTQTNATERITLLRIRALGNDLIQLLCQVVNQSFKLLAVIYMYLYLFWYFHRLICCEAVSRVICSTRELLVR